jgi:hypothetical protein
MPPDGTSPPAVPVSSGRVSAAAGPFAIAATLLLLGGAAKAVRPTDTANALRGVGLPGSRVLVRLGGAAEVVVGLFALVTGGTAAAVLVAVSYLAFAAFIGVAMVTDAPIATCGCFGKDDTPPSAIHLGVNLVAAGAAVAVAIQPGVGLGDVVADQPLGGAPFLLLVAVGVYATFIALTALPRTLALVRIGASRG